MGSIKLLDDVALRNLIMNPALYPEFPYFKTLATKISTVTAKRTGRCGACSRRQMNAQLKQIYNLARVYINNLDTEKRTQFKKLIGADRVRLIIAEPTGSYAQKIW